MNKLSRSLNRGTLLVSSEMGDRARPSNLYLAILKQGLHVNEGFHVPTVSADFADLVFREIEDNPYFVEEVVKALIEQEEFIIQEIVGAVGNSTNSPSPTMSKRQLADASAV